MKKTIFRKMLSFFLALAILISALGTETVSVNAASADYVTIMNKLSTAQPNVPIRYNFSLSRKSDINFVLSTNIRTGVTLTIKDPVTEKTLVTDYLPASNPDWQYQSGTGIYKNTDSMVLDAGNYILEIMFESEVNFELTMNQISQEPKLNKTKLTLTKGFSSTLTVTGGTIKSCTSSKKSVATVTNKGKVTGKKAGTATITVKLTNGKTLTCKVTVKANTYSSTAITVSDIVYNTYAMQAYKASFDSKGNLVIKFKVVNNSYGKITSIPDFKITVKTSGKKVAATYKKSSYSATVKSFSDKNFSVTIPKSSLKLSQSKIDLRTSTITITGGSANTTL